MTRMWLRQSKCWKKKFLLETIDTSRNYLFQYKKHKHWYFHQGFNPFASKTMKNIHKVAINFPRGNFICTRFETLAMETAKIPKNKIVLHYWRKINWHKTKRALCGVLGTERLAYFVPQAKFIANHSDSKVRIVSRYHVYGCSQAVIMQICVRHKY